MIKNYEKGGAIGTPSTFSINWRSSYNVGDKVRIRTDMVGVKNIDYNSDENVFTIKQIDKGGATPFKVDSKGNNIGGFMRDENPSGVLYILDKNGGSWEGKDLEPYLEVNQPIPTSKIDKKIEVSNNLNKEEIQSLVDNFITDNANQIEKISQENPLLFDSVTNILSFISTKLGTREGGIELPKFEPKEEVISTNDAVKESGLKMGICYIKNNNINSYKIGFYQVESIDKNGKDLLIYNKNNLNNSFNISYNDFQKLIKNGDVAYAQNLNFDTLYEKEFKHGKLIFELRTTPLMNHIQINYDREFIISDANGKTSYRLSKEKAFDIDASSEISVEIMRIKSVLTTYDYNVSILEQLNFQVGQGIIKVLENSSSIASNVFWDKENILCYVKQDLFGLQNGFYSLSYSESRNETKFVDNLGIQKNPNMSYSELERLKQLGDIIVYDNIQINDANNVYYFEENKNISLKIKLSTNNGMVLIYLLDRLNKPPQPYIFTINYNYDGGVEAGSFVVYKNSGKENFLKTISRRISEKEIVLVPESSPIVQTLFPQPQQTTTTATTTTTAKKGRKALSQDQKDRIAEIKLEIEGLELIADDDDDAKQEIEKLKNELKQIKNS